MAAQALRLFNPFLISASLSHLVNIHTSVLNSRCDTKSFGCIAHAVLSNALWVENSWCSMRRAKQKESQDSYPCSTCLHSPVSSHSAFPMKNFSLTLLQACLPEGFAPPPYSNLNNQSQPIDICENRRSYMLRGQSLERKEGKAAIMTHLPPSKYSHLLRPHIHICAQSTCLPSKGHSLLLSKYNKINTFPGKQHVEEMCTMLLLRTMNHLCNPLEFCPPHPPSVHRSTP